MLDGLSLTETQKDAVRLEVDKLRVNGWSWRRIANLGAVSVGAAWHYAHDRRPEVGFAMRIMEHAGRPMAIVDACSDCGSAHAGRCNNRPVAKVVALAPGEVVRKTLAPRQVTRIADMSTRDLARAIRERIEYP